MSTTIQTLGVRPLGTTVAPARSTASAPKSGFFTRMFALVMKAQEAKATRHVALFLANQSDARLAEFGFSASEIAEIRATGRVPVSHFE